MKKVFEFVEALPLTLTQQRQINAIKALEPHEGDLVIYDMILQALDEYRNVIEPEFAEWVESVIEAEADYYQSRYEYEMGDQYFERI